jgi:hypothetical protein
MRGACGAGTALVVMAALFAKDRFRAVYHPYLRVRYTKMRSIRTS